MTKPKDAHLRCKAYGHAWEPCSPVGFFRDHSDKALYSVCVRCESEKVDDLNAWGAPVSTHYYYSDAYRRFLDLGMVRCEAREEVYGRAKRQRKSERKLRLVQGVA